MNDIGAIGISGIQRELISMQKSAASLANPNNNNDNMARALVDLHQAKRQVQADAKVISVANQMMGSLLDVFV